MQGNGGRTTSAMSAGDLTWGLVIATKDRLDALKICVEIALAQTHPPCEVVIVDSSDDWEHHDAVISEIVAHFPEVRYAFAAGVAQSTPVQRNQAIGLATADVLFMVDDDSFMHPDCAEQIMAVYEADEDCVVGGVQATLSAELPEGVDGAGDRKKTGNDASSGGADSEKSFGVAGRVVRWFSRRVLLMQFEELFIPYRSRDPALLTNAQREPLPAPVADLDVVHASLFHGCRMTFRRDVILKHLFDPALRYYALGEDLDASYRVSQTSAIVTSERALLHHYTASSGRVNRFAATLLQMTNQAVLLIHHADDMKRARAAYVRLTRRRLFAEFLKDGLSRRFDFPQLRAVWASRSIARQAFDMPRDEVDDWYITEQRRIVKGDAEADESSEASDRVEAASADPVATGSR